MKILIADDEPIAVESLVYIINKNFDNVDIIGTARTGKDAVEQSIRLHPDIVIMDINMPGLNGLEAIKKIRRVNSSISFIIITAYDYFDYAAQSVSLGVEEYLLKPVKESKLVETLSLIIKKVGQGKEKMKESLQQEENLILAIPAIEASFIYSLCMFGENKGELERYCKLLGYNNTGGYVLILEFLRKEDDYIEACNDNSSESQVLNDNIYEEYRSILKSICKCIVGPIMTNQIIVYIFDDKNNNYEQKMSSLKLARKILRRTLKTYPSTYIGIGKYYESVSDAKCSYRQAYHALSHLHNLKNNIDDDPISNHILHEDDIRETQEVLNTDFDQLIDEQFFSKIPYEVENDIERRFNNIFDKSASEDNMDLNTLKNRMINIIIGFVKRWEDVITDYYFVLNGIIQASSKEELHGICKQFLNEVLPYVCNSSQQKVNSIIEKANSYIENNYSGNISLELVAREVNLSSYYFSRFYKDETGINFIDKLSNVRIEKAKELLSNEDLSIKDVSYKVGFTDPNYFSKAFKKITGVTASDYRKL